MAFQQQIFSTSKFNNKKKFLWDLLFSLYEIHIVEHVYVVLCAYIYDKKLWFHPV
jgi:hypothetical protein